MYEGPTKNIQWTSMTELALYNNDDGEEKNNVKAGYDDEDNGDDNKYNYYGSFWIDFHILFLHLLSCASLSQVIKNKICSI